MPNPSGMNGHNNGTKPPDDVLGPALKEYARLNLSRAERLARLDSDFGYRIREWSLKRLNRQFNVVSVRVPPSRAEAAILVEKAMDENLSRRNGPDTIRDKIRRHQGVPLPRDLVRDIMHEKDPSGFDFRFPGKKVIPKVRGHLDGIGVFEEVHCDGHEKLNSKALEMGPVGMDIYGMRDHASGKILFMCVVPNARCESTVAHCYFDFVETYGEIPQQLTVDGGSELGLMRANHIALRLTFAPEMSVTLVPAYMALKSSDNIPIESSWSYLRNYNGHDLKQAILSGKHLFRSMDELHINIFNWLWPQVTQHAIDDFIEYWNSHRVRTQRQKLLPSGASPDTVFKFPHNYSLKHCGIQVDRKVVHELRIGLDGRSRSECFRWVSDDFEVLAQEAYKGIGSPRLHYSQGWDIFTRMYNFIIDKPE